MRTCCAESYPPLLCREGAGEGAWPELVVGLAAGGGEFEYGGGGFAGAAVDLDEEVLGAVGAFVFEFAAAGGEFGAREFLPAEGGHFVQVEVEDVAGGELREVDGAVEATGFGAPLEVVGAAGAHFGHSRQLSGKVVAQGVGGFLRERGGFRFGCRFAAGGQGEEEGSADARQAEQRAARYGSSVVCGVQGGIPGLVQYSGASYPVSPVIGILCRQEQPPVVDFIESPVRKTLTPGARPGQALALAHGVLGKRQASCSVRILAT